MTNLEKFLMSTTVSLGAAFTYLWVKSYKYCKSNIEFNKELNEKLLEMKDVLEQTNKTKGEA